MSSPADTFRTEAQDLLEQLEQDLLDLERDTDDAALVDSIFRSLHTLKGSGAMFGFDACAAFTHHVETAFDQVRKGLLAPSRELVAVVLDAKDHIRALIESEGEVAGGDDILARLHAAVEGAGAKAAPGPVTWRIRFRLPDNAMVTGVNPLGLLDELRELGPCTVVAETDDVPCLEDFDPTSCRLSWNVLLSTEQPKSAIEDVFIFVIDEMELQIEQAPPAEGAWRLGDILVARNDVAPEAVEAAAASQAPIGTLLVQAGQLSKDKLAAALGEQQHMAGEVALGVGGLPLHHLRHAGASDAVLALQVGDCARQRLEHVGFTLDLADQVGVRGDMTALGEGSFVLGADDCWRALAGWRPLSSSTPRASCPAI
jgi:two-component system chemotaxis sensor kinase CheA